MTKTKAKPEASKAMQLLDFVWGAIPYRSHRNSNSAMHSALRLAITEGFGFAINDFAEFHQNFRASYWLHLDQCYSEACGSNPNIPAALSIEAYLKRDPFIWKWDTSSGERVHVGFRFRWKGIAVRVTSISASQFIACSYKPSETSHSDQVDRVFKIKRDEFTELQKDWSRYRRQGIFEVHGVKTWHAEQIEDAAIPEGTTAWKGIFWETQHVEAFLVRIVGDDGETRYTHTETIEQACQIIESRGESAKPDSRTRTIIQSLMDGTATTEQLETTVTIPDSQSVNCSVGTSEWVSRNMPGRDSATVAELLKIDDQRHYVLRACAAAIAKARVGK